MTDNNEIKSLERRNFLKLSGSAGFTAAVVAGASGALLSSPAMAVTAKEEKRSRKSSQIYYDIGDGL